jgi:hypothetical protein
MLGCWQYPRRWGFAAALTGLAAGTISPQSALAHVKWFAPYDVPGQPRVLSDVLDLLFWQPIACAVVALLLTCYAERGGIGRAVLRTLDLISTPLRPRIDDLYRAGTGAFFIALAVHGGIILTPDLTTNLPQIPWFQAAFALGMFWRRTMVISAAGIVALYAYGVSQYGIYHLLDYPIFLGLAGYLALYGLDRDFLGLRPLDVSRWAAAITLMWASVEKWAYPQWTFPLIQSHPSLAMGFYANYYMNAAGVVEFSLAFGLLWTPLVRRLSALVLAAMFISAIFPFGMLDAVGHLMIIVILVGVLLDREPDFAKPPIEAAVYFFAALAIDLAAYYGLHAALFGTLIW